MNDPTTRTRHAGTDTAASARGPNRTEPSTLEARLADFRPTAYPDFSDPDNARRMREAIAEVREELGREYPNRIGGEDVRLEETIESVNPADPDEVVGVFPLGGEEHADRAIEAAEIAFETWSERPADERAELLFRVADAMREPERKIILKALRANDWNRQATAKDLDINRTTLYKKMRALGMDREMHRGAG